MMNAQVSVQNPTDERINQSIIPINLHTHTLSQATCRYFDTTIIFEDRAAIVPGKA